MLLKRLFTLLAIPFIISCSGPEETADKFTRETISPYLFTSGKPAGRYAVIELPLKSGVGIWNPVQIVRGPDSLMYAANNTGEIYSLHDTDGDGLEDHAELFCDVRDQDLRAPASILFINEDLYVGAAQGIYVYRDTDSDGRADSTWTFFDEVPYSEHPYEWTSGLTLGPDNHLYFVLTTDSWNAGPAPDPDGVRGAMIRISADGKSSEIYATGLRSVPAMAFDPYYRLWFVDNEGGGNPDEELNLAVRGKFYGHNPEKYGNPDPTGPELSLVTGVAPSGMTFNDSSNVFGGTAGDLFISYYGPGERWNRGSIGKVSLTLQKNGEYKAAESSFINDIPKISDLEFGYNGDLYATHVGKTDYWYQALEAPDGKIFRIIEASWAEPAELMESAEMANVTQASVEKGRQLFIDYSCNACHAVDGKTELLGPNLKDILLTYSREELVEEIRDPSARIKPSMAPTRIEKTNGEILLGRAVTSNEEVVRIMIIGNRIIDVPRAEIKNAESVMVSMMYEGLIDNAPEEDVNALLDYLQSLTDKNNARSGM